MDSIDFVVLGAGVIGLTTALEIRNRHPESRVLIIAKYIPGDRSIEYTSPWAGANWLSAATDNGRQESWDEHTYHKFSSLCLSNPECGIQKMEIRSFFDSKIEDAGVFSEGTGKIWYEELVGGLRKVKEEELKGAVLGYDMDSFQIEVPVYLGWLYNQVLKSGIKVKRATVEDIRDIFRDYPSVKTVFNCTGLGSYSLKGVEDTSMFPIRGQVILVENPTPPIQRMYERTPQHPSKDATYVFPRNPGGGVILGGCRLQNNWSGEVDLDFAEDIKRRCCELAPELGKPEDLRVLQHGVGLRPSRKGGARIEKEKMERGVVIHNYGAGGAGYQASWGMAKEAVDLLWEECWNSN